MTFHSKCFHMTLTNQIPPVRFFTYVMSEGKKDEENVLVNDTLNTFYLRLYVVEHMIKIHLDSERGNPMPTLHEILFCD